MVKNYIFFIFFLFFLGNSYAQTIVKPESRITNTESIKSNEDLLLTQNIKLYPNPVANNLTIDSEIRLIKVEIFTLLGQRVKIVNNNFRSINLEYLSKGIYMIKIHSEKGITVRKLIKK